MSNRHQAVQSLFLLMRRARGKPLTRPELDRLAGSDESQLVRLATSHFVAPFIAKAFEDTELGRCFDEDFIAFMRYLRAQNAERNRQLLRQMTEAAGCLSAEGIAVVALKGAAELAEPVHDEPADRFLCDLDLLVAQKQVDEAIAILTDRGYSGHGAEYDRSRRHAPALWREGELTAIELHTAPSNGTSILRAEAVMERARPSRHASIAVPTPGDRLCHLVAHAQIDHHGYYGHWLSLRDVADLAAFHRTQPAAVFEQAFQRFARAGQGPAFKTLAAAAARVLDEPIAEPDPQSAGWADTAIALLSDRRSRRYHWFTSKAVSLMQRLSRERQERHRFLRKLASRRQFKGLWHNLVDGFREIQ